MAIAQLAGQDSIVAALETIQGVDVYEGQYVTDGSHPPMDENGYFVPYLTVVFGSSYQGPDRGIVSERYNNLRTTVTVYSVAPIDRLSRQFKDAVAEKLLGFVPTDGTQLEAYGGYTYVDADLGKNRYVHAAVFSYSTNMSISI